MSVETSTIYYILPVLCQAYQGCRGAEFQYVLAQAGSQSVGTRANDGEQPVPCAPPDL
jgi:hypothetical protein